MTIPATLLDQLGHVAGDILGRSMRHPERHLGLLVTTHRDHAPSVDHVREAISIEHHR